MTRDRHRHRTGRGRTASLPRSPVRTRATASTGCTQILPSPIVPGRRYRRRPCRRARHVEHASGPTGPGAPDRTSVSQHSENGPSA
ncbi:hypothetical protein Ae168Ps1_0886 [Pseudonocardia sp. Ae168_Ps1]|nr:hypothetical protein Ae168Ps1_0886 [Pseudonocardia sp. Ae168_Ps1]